jgi:serine/threonine protein kinase
MIIKPGISIINGDNEEFEVIEEIGAGGCGVVYKIQNKSTKNSFAVKTLSPSFTDDKLLKGLINEAQMAIQISHINVLKYYFFHDGSQFPELPPYIIMEFANGGSLATLIENAKEQIAESELLNIYSSLISGMKAINEKIIHRDIKPENILLKDDVLKIADFGLSKIIDEKTRTSSFKGWGTPKYIAPEAWVGKKNTIQMDVYSMGIMFYELLTLSYPFELTNPYDYSEWQNVHLYSPPKQIEKLRTDTSPKLAQIISKMIEKEISVRYKNWEEIESDLEGLEISTEIDSTIARIVKKKMEKDEEQLKEKLEAEKIEDRKERLFSF